MKDFVSRFKGVRQKGKGWTAKCPCHDDKRNSLSLDHDGSKWLLKCHAGCANDDIVAAIGLKLADLFDEQMLAPRPARARAARKKQGEGGSLPPKQPCNCATVARPGAGTVREREAAPC